MLSVILPTNNSEELLAPTLAALVPGAVAGLVREVILADLGSTDGTLAIADAAGCVVASAPSSAGGFKAAAAQARAPWLMFLRPGFVPDPRWVDEVARFIAGMEATDAAHAATFRARVAPDDHASMLREIVALLRARALRSLRPDHGLVLSKRFYDTLGGHRDAAQDPEADLMRRIGRARITMLACGGRIPPMT